MVDEWAALLVDRRADSMDFVKADRWEIRSADCWGSWLDRSMGGNWVGPSADQWVDAMVVVMVDHWVDSLVAVLAAVSVETMVGQTVDSRAFELA